jgi:signal transduction histidine kinase
MVVTTQSLLVTLVALTVAPTSEVVGILVLLGLALAGLACVVLALSGLDGDAGDQDDAFAVSLGLAFVAAVSLLLLFPIGTPSTAVRMLLGVVVSTHVAVVALVAKRRAVRPELLTLLAATAGVGMIGIVVEVSGLMDSAWGAVVALMRAAAGAAWIGLAWIHLQRAADEDRRRLEEFDLALVATARDYRERMHELRSTVAGLVNGSALLDNDEISDEARHRLWESVRRELDRMQRLLSEQETPAIDLDVDEALSVILDLQRLKGREVEYHSSGDVVHARYDALAEVVNILMDNAATHGGSRKSVVEVDSHDDMVDITVTDFGRGIPPDKRQQIFGWGVRGSDSRGEGIGLNVARRLMTEDGGSLRLAEPEREGAGVGSQFVISLPRARRSPENDVRREGSHVGWNGPS